MNGSQAVVGFDRHCTPANANHEEPSPRVAELEAELQAQEPVIGAAILVATSFRLRDEAKPGRYAPAAGAGGAGSWRSGLAQEGQLSEPVRTKIRKRARRVPSAWGSLP